MKPIFSRNIDIDKMAFINWRISRADAARNLLVMADGFIMSSIELARNCLADNIHKKADILIFPILTNAGHGIELYLKAILGVLNSIENKEFKIEGRHNIKQIYETVRSKIISYKGQVSVKDFDEGTIELKNYIDELFEKINATPRNDKMDFSRYPFSSKYENHFYVNEIGNVEIDLENFICRFEIIHHNLNSLSFFLLYQELKRN